MNSFLAIGNEELGELIEEGDLVTCPGCRKRHKARFAKDILGIPSNMIIAVRCREKSYLVGVAGRAIEK